MQTIYIDISNKGMIQPVYAKQGDIGRKFVAVFMENGGRYNIPSGSMFSAWYKGSSGEGNYTDVGEKSAFSIANNRVIVELISEMLGVPGEGFICLVLTKSDGGQIGSWNIPYICEEVPGFGSEEVTQYFTAFSKALEDIRSNPENIHIDNSLSMGGSAADAAAVGLKVQEHDNLIADNAVEIAMLKEKVESGGITDEEFAAKVEEKVVFELQSGSGEIFDNVQRISANISDESLYNSGIVENDENGDQVYHAYREDNPHKVSCEQIGAVAEDEFVERVKDIITVDINEGGVVSEAVYYTAELAAGAGAEMVMQNYDLLVPGEDGESLIRNVPTYEELEEAIAEPQYELVRSVVTSGETTISIEGIALDAFALFVETPAGTEAKGGTVTIVKGNKTVWSPWVNNAVITAGASHFAVYGKNEKGLAILEYTNATSATASQQKYVNRAPFYVEGNTPFTRVSFNCSALPAGTKAELWGIVKQNYLAEE